ncbi:MAG: signal peptidase I [bacterium]|nr:signal peptidase I [bacterium]
MEKVNSSMESAIDNANVVLDGDETVKRFRLLRLCIPLLVYIVIVFFFSFMVPKFLLERTQVKGASMEDTLHDGDDIVINKLAYRFSSPSRYDVIVFYPQGNVKGDYFVKRVIALPGETIQIINGVIFIDGKQVEEDYGTNAIVGAGQAANPITLGKNEYFVLGDNRIISKDSRYESVGIVKKDYIVGEAWLRIFPMKEFGRID